MAQLVIPTTEQFNFERTVLSHGWYMLAPFHLQRDEMILHYTYQAKSGDILRLGVSADDTTIHVVIPEYERISDALSSEIEAVVSRILNVDWDLGEFYQAMQNFDGYDWLEHEQRGRILIAPTLWEDLAKVLFTTNTTWAQTIQMSERLCQLGTPHTIYADCYAFPTAQMIAQIDFDTLANHLRAGYRTAYLYDVAQSIATGEVDIEAWRDLDGQTLNKRIKSIKGYGDYSAGTILRMLGHFDKLAIDSACREMYAKLHNKGEKGTDADIKAHYAQFGRWQGLVMWMNIMRR